MKMDGPSVEHSDSDSGDSWTLLENSTYADDAPDFPELPSERPAAENHEKDEDTDGISIISDSEPDSPSPCQLNYETIADEHFPSNQDTAQYISVDPPLHNLQTDHESIREEDDLLGDNGQKHKTYVHRRNKRLSTVLNIVVMASVITAAGVAIGHMWGAKTDCTLHNTPGVNKILSNLYRLQEENAYLRSKLKELTVLSNIQTNHQKVQLKQNRCKKMFEESLNNKNDKKPNIICLDDRYTNDQNIQKMPLNNLSPEKKINGNVRKLSYSDSLKANINIVNEDNLAYKKDMFDINVENVDKNLNKRDTDKIEVGIPVPDKYLGENKEKKIIHPQTIFEESIELLQVENPIEPISGVDNSFDHNVNIINKQDLNKNGKSIEELAPEIKVNYNTRNRKLFQKYSENVFVPKGDKSKQSKDTYYGMEIDTFDEDDITKDNRYTGPKQKQDKKKYDRHKLHKKDKRRNKYEKWEMKGGYLKDYDEISFASSQESGFLIEKPISKEVGDDFVIVTGNDLDRCSDSLDDSNKSDGCYIKNHNHKKEKENDPDWFNKRAVSRKEARRLLEKEMFHEVPNTAGWHFRRMRKREQCRAKSDNSTYRKLSKHIKNYKTKQ